MSWVQAATRVFYHRGSANEQVPAAPSLALLLASWPSAASLLPQPSYTSTLPLCPSPHTPPPPFMLDPLADRALVFPCAYTLDGLPRGAFSGTSSDGLTWVDVRENPFPVFHVGLGGTRPWPRTRKRSKDGVSKATKVEIANLKLHNANCLSFGRNCGASSEI